MRIFRNGSTLVSTLLNIIGLTFAFAALYIIIVQVHYDLTYNKGLKDSERIYLVTAPDSFNEGKYNPFVNRPIIEGIIRDLPIIESGGIVFPEGNYSLLYLTEDSDPVEIKIADATIGGIDALGYKVVEGSWDEWEKTALGLSESFASRLGLHYGDHFKLGDNDFSVAVIYKDHPQNSDFSLHDAVFNMGEKDIDSEVQWNYNYFVKFQSDVSEEEIKMAIDSHLRNWFKERAGDSNENIDDIIKRYGLKFFPLQDIYLSPIVEPIGFKGNKTTSLTLLGVAILIIIIACINYFNFFFALIPLKLKDLNTKRILGSTRRNLIRSMMMESLFFMAIALGLSAVLVVIFSHSTYAGLISTSVLFKYHWGMTFITIGIGIVTAILSSLFPAFYITSFNPALAMKGFIGSSSRGNVFRTCLIGFQFTISIILMVCAIVINQQRNYMLKHDMGFDRENLLTVELSRTAAYKPELVESLLKKESSIIDVTWADGPIVADSRMAWGRELNGETIHFEAYPVAWNFLKFMNIPIVEGRDFNQSDVEDENGLFILNEDARNKYDIKIGDRFTGHLGANSPAEVVGFVKNFNYMPLRETGGTFSFYQFGKHPWRPLKQLFVRTNPNVDIKEVKEKITDILCDIDPERHRSLWNIELVDTTLEHLYAKENNLSKLINLFTLLAIVISLMGVFGLVMFDTERRKKEIGVRRVNGATVEEILGMFNMKFIKIIIVSFIIAIPVSWWIMRVYLESYAYKTPIYIWVFFVALLAVLIITTGVVTLRSYNAATANPVESLRTE